MKYTPEQLAKFEADRRANPAGTSFDYEPTPEQAAEFAALHEKEKAGEEENREFAFRLESLLADDSFLGSVRRELADSPRSWEEHGSDTGIPVERLRAFFEGDVELTSSEIGRLVGSLGLRLTHVA